jgi:hypothetical protein
MTFYVHSVPGRLRVKIPSIKGRPLLADMVQDVLEGLQGLENLEIKAVTGSVKVNYDPNALTCDDILTCLEKTGFFDRHAAQLTENATSKGSHQVSLAIGKALFSWIVGKTLEPRGLSFLAALI